VASVHDIPVEATQAASDVAAQQEQSHRPSFFHEHPRAKWAILGVAVMVAVAAYFGWNYYSTRESTDDAQIDGHIIPVSARVGGFVEKVLVEQNQEVKAGTVLCRIDPAEYRIAVEHAQADLADAQAAAQGAHTAVPITSVTTGSQLANAQAAAQVARAAIDSGQKQIDAARAGAASMQAGLRQAESDYQNASQDLKRYQQLVVKDDISRQRYDAAVTKVHTTKAAVDAAQAGVAAAEQSVAIAESNLAQAKARAAQAEAEVRSAGTAPQQVAVTEANANSAAAKVLLKQAALDQARLNLQYTVVTAPVDGVVGEKDVETGMNVQTAQPLLSIVPLNDIWVTANFKESQLRRMRPGQKAVITVDSYGGRKYSGYVESIAPATGEKFSLLPPENATGNYVKVVQRIPVRLRLDHGQDPQHLLRPGMSVTATVITR
jgi:membrane fusion protein, multidrug efflux system